MHIRASVERSGWREILLFTGLALAFVFQLYVLFFPGKASFDRYPLAVPDAFTDIPPLRPAVLATTFLVAAVVLVAAVRRWSTLVAWPRLAVLGICMFGIALHLAMIGSLRDGFSAFHRRAIFTGHNEFVFQAVRVRDLSATVSDYEPYVRQHIYLSNKGPGTLAFYYGLRVVANAPGIRLALGPAAQPTSVVEGWLREHNQAMPPEQVEELRHLLALMFVSFPVLTCLPVFLLFWIGRALADADLGLLAALLYPFVPAVGLNVAHLDFALFPLLATATLVPFVVGIVRAKLWSLALSACAFVAYFVTTMAAAALLAFLVTFAGLAALQVWRTGEGLRPTGSLLWRGTVLYTVIGGSVLGVLYLAFGLDFVERYTHARSIQRHWGDTEYNWFWIKSNLLGWLLSFGLTQAALLVGQLARSLIATFSRCAQALDTVAVSWLVLVLALVTVGRQHGETNRLWTFLSPLACLFVARLVHDGTTGRRYLAPILLFLMGLILARYRLSYF